MNSEPQQSRPVIPYVVIATAAGAAFAIVALVGAPGISYAIVAVVAGACYSIAHALNRRRR